MVVKIKGFTVTFKQRNCTVTIKQDRITHNEKGATDEVSFVEYFTRCSAIAERPRCRVRYSFRQK